MAASISIEEVSGVFSGSMHSHSGYYAGDFAGSRSDALSWSQTSPTSMCRRPESPGAAGRRDTIAT